jgi:hypothetical protein
LTPPVAVVALVAGFSIAIAATMNADGRRRLGLAHPAVAWLALTAVFFGLGTVALAVDGRPGSAAFTGAAVAAFGAGLWLSDRLSTRRAPGTAKFATGVVAGAADRLRLWAIAATAAVAVAAILPTLLRTGLPFLVPDITGARAELTGLPVQLVRVALPGAAAVAFVGGFGATDPRTRRTAAVAVLAVASFELLLASRYLLAELAAALALVVLLAGFRVPMRVVAVALIGAVLLFGAIQVLRAAGQAEGREGPFAVERTVNRIVLIQPRTLDALMTVIPDEQPYFLGLTWLHRLAPALGREDIPNLGYWIYPRVVDEPQATAGYAAPGWLGEAWANLGWAGVALFALLGAAVERLAALITTRRDETGALSTADLIAAALAVLFVARTHALGVAGLGVVLALVVAWRVLAAPLEDLTRDLGRTLLWRT